MRTRKGMIIYSHKIRAADGAGGLRIILPGSAPENHQSGIMAEKNLSQTTFSGPEEISFPQNLLAS